MSWSHIFVMNVGLCIGFYFGKKWQDWFYLSALVVGTVLSGIFNMLK